MTDTIEDKISILIKHQFPQFYREEGPVFVEFVTEYYRWMESKTRRSNNNLSQNTNYVSVQSNSVNVIGTNTSFTTEISNGDYITIEETEDDYHIYRVETVSNNTFLTLDSSLLPDFSKSNAVYGTANAQPNPIYYTRRFDDIQDVDETLEEFIVYFKQKYLRNIQLTSLTDTKYLIKNSLDLYRSKGTENGLKLLFRILYGIDAKVYYPKEDLFKLSDGHWFTPKYLEVSLGEQSKNFVNKEIVGVKSGATAFVESVIRRTVNGKLIDVIYIDTINGNFQTGEKVKPSDDSISVSVCPSIIGSLNYVDVDVNGIGTGFTNGDLVSITSTFGEQGQGVVANTANSTGLVTFVLLDGGYGYTANANVYVSEYVLSLSNVIANGQHNSFFNVLDGVTQPIANINYEGGNGAYTNGEAIYTYHSNGSLKGTGTVLTAIGNSTVGELRVSILSGDLEDNAFYTTANAIGANQAVTNGFFDMTATANVVGWSTNSFTVIANNNVGTLADGYQVKQTNSTTGYVIGTATINSVSTNLSNTLINLTNACGVFVRGQRLETSNGTISANIQEVTMTLGVYGMGACSFLTTDNNYFYDITSGANAVITGVSEGTGATFALSNTYTYSEYVDLNTDLISDYVATTIDAAAYAMPGDVNGNLTSNTIENILTYSNNLIGKLTSLVSINPGSGYTSRPFVELYEPKTAIYDIPDTLVLTYSNNDTNFDDGELVTQGATGARGLVESSNSTHLTIERLYFNDANAFLVTSNSTTYITGEESGSNAYVNLIEVDNDFKKNIGFNATVNTALNASNGAITSIKVIDSGFGFVHNETVTLTSGNNVANGVANNQTHGTGSGYYLDKGGFPSDVKKIHDGHYWQDFSYEIQSSIGLAKYKDMLKNVMHVAGTKIFGKFVHDAQSNLQITSTGNTSKITFSPELLFASSEDGLWIDPNDTTSLRLGTNGSGGVPATNAVAGMVLDKSQMYGNTAANFIAGQAELVTNGTFNANVDGWSAARGSEVLSHSSGALRVTTPGATYGAVQTLTGLTVGDYYIVSIDADNTNNSSTIYIRFDDASDLSTSGATIDTISGGGSETVSAIVQATATTMYIGVISLAGSGGEYFEADNISIKHMPGNHMVAPSDAARPLLRLNNDSYSIEFDGVDDNISAALGTNFTGDFCLMLDTGPIYGSIDTDVDTTWGYTKNPAYIPDGKMVGLIVLNRSLTLSEKRRINTYYASRVTSTPSTAVDAFRARTDLTALDTSYGDWTSVTDASSAFYNCNSLTTAPNVPGWTGVTNAVSVFHNCSSLTSPPDVSRWTSVTNATQAFTGCSGLTTAPNVSGWTGVLDASYAFYNCTSLTTATAVSGWTSVTNAAHTFRNCNSLTSPPDVSGWTAVTNASYAFRDCSSLTTPPDVSGWTSVAGSAAHAFYGCSSLTTPPDVSGWTAVTGASSAFSGCSGLTSPPNVSGWTSVNDASYTFYGCSGLTTAPNVTGWTGVTNATSAFRGCSSLTSPPDVSGWTGVTSAPQAFHSCSGLTTPPDVSGWTGVTDVTYVFFNCSGLTTPPNVSGWTSVTLAAAAFYGCSGLTSPPNVSGWTGVTNASSAFYGCSGLTTAPDVSGWTSVTNAAAAFFGCSSLTSPPDVSGWTSVAGSAAYAFYNCSSLTSPPDVSGWTGVTNASYTFRGCSSLTSLPNVSGWTSVTDASFAFLNCSGLTTVPASYFDSWICADCDDMFAGCALTQTSVDNILVSFDTNGVTNGVLDLDGGTSASPSGTGTTAKTNLEGDGWTVTVN